MLRVSLLRAGTRWRSALARLRADRSGVAALEFALVVPLLMCMYFVTMEVAQAIDTDKKVSRLGSMVADLVTQQPTMDKANLEDIMEIGEATLAPYYRSRPTVIITGIEITDQATPQVKVLWSRKMVGGAFSVDETKGETTEVPESLRIKGSFLVRVQSQLEYRPVITWAAADKPALGLAAAFDKIDMGETYYLRPRMTQTIPCSDC